MAVGVDEARELESVRHAREDTRVLRRLLVVGLAWACLLPRCAAQAGTVAIFYYPWYGTPARDGAWQHWNQNGHRPPGDVYSRFYPARGAVLEHRPGAWSTQQMAEIAAAGVDEVSSPGGAAARRRTQRLPLVLAAARRHGLQPAIHLEPYAGPLDGDDRAGPRRTSRHSGSATSTSTTRATSRPPTGRRCAPQLPPSLRLFAGTELVGFAAAGRFDGFYTYDFINFGGGEVRAALRAGARDAHPLRAERRPGLRRPACRRVLAVQLARDNGSDVRQPLDGGARRAPGHRSRSRATTSGERARRSSRRRRHRGYDTYDGAWGLIGAAAQMAYLMRTAYWAGRFHAVPVSPVYLCRDGDPRSARSAGPAAERADARPPARSSRSSSS